MLYLLIMMLLMKLMLKKNQIYQLGLQLKGYGKFSRYCYFGILINKHVFNVVLCIDVMYTYCDENVPWTVFMHINAEVIHFWFNS